MLQNGLKAAWRTRRAPREAKLDDEFYKETARHIRELADKPIPLSGSACWIWPATTIQSWGDHLVQRLPWICRVSQPAIICRLIRCRVVRRPISAMGVPAAS